MPSADFKTQTANFTFSDHYGISKVAPDKEHLQQILYQYVPMNGSYIYAHAFPTEQCILNPWHSDILGFNEPVFDINRLIEMVHPCDVEKAWRLSAKALDYISTSKRSPEHFVYRITYRMRAKGHQYIRILRETRPLTFDGQGKLISSVSYITDISRLGHPGEVKSWLTFADQIINITQEDCPLLSKREREVLHYLAGGYSSKSIAHLLNISKLTVDKHRANMLSKANVNNTSELITYAIDQGLL